METNEVQDELTRVLVELADEVDRIAKYHRVAVQYGSGKFEAADGMAVAVIDSAVRKIRRRIP